MVYIIADHIITSLGNSAREHFDQMAKGKIGISKSPVTGMAEQYQVAMINDTQWDMVDQQFGQPEAFTRLERLVLYSIKQVAEQSGVDPTSADTGIVLSSTKGNIELLEPTMGKQFPDNRIHLSSTARVVQDYFGTPNKPVVVCNACISGVMAIIVGARLIRLGRYKKVIVSGADMVSAFTLSGFAALKALSPEPCRPFDKDRIGINLGEGCGTVVLSAEPNQDSIAVLGGSISNDANHISGPSRTGSGLQLAVKSAIKEAGYPEIDYISAHGTATLYNDEMEAKAFHALDLSGIPLNSFKGYWGHTLGAAGLLETIVACQSLRNNTLLASAGYKDTGVTVPLNVIDQVQETKELKVCLKTSSGFGGCNGAMVLKKIQN